MKKMIYLIAAGMFFSCADNQLEPVGDTLQPIEVLTTKAEMPDVSVENGYLVLKDLDALDALESDLSQMTLEERVSWEYKIGFESAYTHFKPYFDEFEALESDEEIALFQERNKGVVRIVNDEVYCEVNYPFEVEDLEWMLSKEGKIKVGKTLWSYKSDRKIVIHDADKEKIEKYDNATFSHPDEGVYVYRLGKTMLRDGRESGAVVLIDRIEDRTKHFKSDGREYGHALEILKREFKDNSGKIVQRRILALYQKGWKVRRGKLKVYSTKYEAQVRFEKVDALLAGNDFTARQTSKDKKGGIYFKIFYIDEPDIPAFSISIYNVSGGYAGSDANIFYKYGNPGGSSRKTIYMIARYYSNI